MYTYYCRIRGVKLSGHCTIHYKSDLQNPQNIYLGENSIIYKNNSIYLGPNGRFSMKSNGHIAPFGYILAENQSLDIGSDAAIGPFCSFFCVSNTYSSSEPLYRKNYTRENITIGDNVFIGAHSSILPGTSIGDNCIIAAHSVVKGNLESGFLYGGTPCKKIKKLQPDD